MAVQGVLEPRGEDSCGWRATRGDEKSHLQRRKVRLPTLAVDPSAQAFFLPGGTEEQREGQRGPPCSGPELEGQPAPQVTLLPLCAWQDIILTVKEKLSIRSMEYFALALEEQYNISRLHLLHEEELIQQVHLFLLVRRSGLGKPHTSPRTFGARAQHMCSFDALSCALTQPGDDRARIRADFHMMYVGSHFVDVETVT